MAAVVAVGVVVAVPERRHIVVETDQVQLTAAVLSAVGNVSTMEVASPAAATKTVPALAAVQAGVPSAAAETATDESFWDTPLGTVLAVANFIALPLWFFATPITLPLSMLVAASTVTMDGAFGTLQFLIATGLGFISGPLGLLSLVLNSPASAAAAEAPVSGRSAAELPAQPAATSSSAPAAQDAVDAGPVAEAQASAVKRPRVRPAERRAGLAARAAATTTATAAAEPALETPVDTASPAAEDQPAQADSAPSANAKSRAKAHARR